jgi:3-phosphoshikimate 1-carboxyvinyltransferase
MAGLAGGKSVIENTLMSDDTLRTLNALRLLGIDIVEDGGRLVVEGGGGSFSPPREPIDLGNSGTSMRFFTTVAGLAKGEVELTGDESLRSRPMTPLLECLGNLGVAVRSLGGAGNAPIEISGQGRIEGGSGSISGSISSQFVSSLLIASPYFERGLRLSIEGDLISRPYVDLTIEMMGEFGIDVGQSDGQYVVEPGQSYLPRELRISGDYSSGSFPMTAAAITGSTIEVQGLRANSHQADEAFLTILKDMGCEVSRRNESVEIEGGNLVGIDIDLSNSPDLLPPVSILASVANGPSSIGGVEHARFKESDRIESLYQELRRVGIRVAQQRDGLSFRGGDRPTGQEIFARGDHRLAMAFAVLGMVSEGLIVRGASCFDVSYPCFYQDMVSLGAKFLWT